MLQSRRDILLASLSVGAVYALPRAAGAQSGTKLAVACVSPGQSVWPFYLAQEAGISDREHLEFDPIYTGNIATSVQDLVSGAADFALTTFELGILAIDHGAPIVGVAGTLLKYSYSFLAAPKIAKPVDLKGTKIASDAPNSILTMTFDAWAARNGLKPADYDFVYFGASNARFAAVASGAASVCVLTQPQEFIAEDQGLRKLFDMASFSRPYGWTVMLARTAWVNDHPETMRAVNRAVSGGISYFDDVRHRSEAADALVREQKIDLSLALRTYDYFRATKCFSPKVAIPDAYMSDVATSLYQLGLIKRVLKVDQYIDRRFCPER